MKFILTTIAFILGFFAPSIYRDFSNQYTSIFVLSGLIFIGYGTYKFKFGKISLVKFYLLRNYIYLKWLLNNVNQKLNTENEVKEILPIQTKSMRLWKLLLKDPDSQISCSLVNRIRQIEKDNMLLILSPLNQIDYQLTIMDVDSNKSCLYEIPIYGKFSEALIETFDNENERRMYSGQSEKKESIHNDLDKLISQQEFVLTNKISKK